MAKETPLIRVLLYLAEQANAPDWVKDEIGLIKTEPADKFIKPTLDEVWSYMKEMRVEDSKAWAVKWYNHYVSNGWKVGKNPMKNWKAAIATWDLPKRVI